MIGGIVKQSHRLRLDSDKGYQSKFSATQLKTPLSFGVGYPLAIEEEKLGEASGRR